MWHMGVYDARGHVIRVSGPFIILFVSGSWDVSSKEKVLGSLSP